MLVKAGDLLYKYTLQPDEIVLRVGAVEVCRKKIYVHFDMNSDGEKFPGYKNVGRVWKDGKTLWMYERDDSEAKRLFTEAGVARIEELQHKIDDVADMIKKLRWNEVKAMSRCFEDVNAYRDEIKVDEKPEDVNPTAEYNRSRKDSWNEDFKSPTQYVAHKVKMLRNEMYIRPTVEEIQHLKSLETRTAIDNAVHSIIDRYWGDN